VILIVLFSVLVGTRDAAISPTPMTPITRMVTAIITRGLFVSAIFLNHLGKPVLKHRFNA